MCLEKEVPVVRLRNTAVNHRASLTIGRTVGVRLADGIEARMVPLTDDDNVKTGMALFLVCRGLSVLTRLP
jgi:hypothetical protein